MHPIHGYNRPMDISENPATVEQARATLRRSMRRTRWLRRAAVTLALVIAGLILMIRFQG